MATLTQEELNKFSVNLRRYMMFGGNGEDIRNVPNLTIQLKGPSMINFTCWTNNGNKDRSGFTFYNVAVLPFLAKVIARIKSDDQSDFSIDMDNEVTFTKEGIKTTIRGSLKVERNDKGIHLSVIEQGKPIEPFIFRAVKGITITENGAEVDAKAYGKVAALSWLSSLEKTLQTLPDFIALKGGQVYNPNGSVSSDSTSTTSNYP